MGRKPRKGVLAGSKIAGTHLTLTQTAEKVVSSIKPLDCVVRISPGRIKPVWGGRKHLSLQDIGGGLRIRVRGDGAIQNLMIYTKDQQAVHRHLRQEMSSWFVSPKKQKKRKALVNR